MKPNTISLLKLSGIILITSSLIFSCGAPRKESENKEKAYADSVEQLDSLKNKKTIVFNPDSERLFVRKADLNFKVKDVKLATFEIERITNDNNGYVTSSMLESTINYKNSFRISEDSLKEITNYNVHNVITLRVPNSLLDKTLSEIAVLMDYLDHRKVYAEDVTKDFQLSALSQHNFKTHKERIEKVIDEKGKKLNSTLEAENDLYEKQNQANIINVDTKEIAHDVAYSTVEISIYQRESTKSDTYAYIVPLKPYEPPFTQKFINALTGGANGLGTFLLFFVNIWPLTLLIIGFLIAFKRIKRLKVFN